MATERQKEYSKYLKSDKWKQKRQEVLEKYNNKCIICDAIENLHVHHWSYENIGNELTDHLFVLCKGCHLSVHKGRIKLWIFNVSEYESFKKIEHIVCDNNIDYLIRVIRENEMG